MASSDDEHVGTPTRFSPFPSAGINNGIDRLRLPPFSSVTAKHSESSRMSFVELNKTMTSDIVVNN